MAAKFATKSAFGLAGRVGTAEIICDAPEWLEMGKKKGRILTNAALVFFVCGDVLQALPIQMERADTRAQSVKAVSSY
jgi:hypothetical protein